jgi:hypothetical protein
MSKILFSGWCRRGVMLLCRFYVNDGVPSGLPVKPPTLADGILNDVGAHPEMVFMLGLEIHANR